MSGVPTVETTGVQPTNRRVVAFLIPLFLLALFLVAVPDGAHASAAGGGSAAAATAASGAAGAQIDPQAIICPILNALAAAFEDIPFLGAIIDALREAFGCPAPSPG